MKHPTELPLNKSSVRVLIVDDDLVVADVLAVVLKKAWGAELRIVGDVETAKAEVTASGPYDLVLADFRLPGDSGLPFITDLVRMNGPSPVVLMSGKVGPETIHASIMAGARGYISKRIGVHHMLSRLEIVLSGETYIPPEVLVAEVADQTSPPRIRLTDRERQVLSEVRQGRSNKEVARDLGISDITVKLHVRSLLKKFSLKNRTQLAMMDLG